MKRLLAFLVIVLCLMMIFTSCTRKKNQQVHAPEVVRVVAPSCVSVGYTEYKCKHCGDGTWIDDVVFATGHIWGDGVAIDKEDCTTRGIYESKCLACDEVNRYTVNAIGHSYAEISQDGETVAYECSLCADVVNIASDERIEDYIAATELFDVETSFVFNVISSEGEAYIRENLKLLDAYFNGSEYENDSDALVGYDLRSNGNNSYTVVANTGYLYDNTYIAKLSGDVTFEEYRGRELLFTVLDDPNHENEVEYKEGVVFLSALQEANGGYYPYQVNSSEDGGSLYLVVNKIDGISKGQILCIGEVGSLAEISYDTECYFGIVDGFYPLDNGKWMVTLAEPELQTIFNEFDIAFNEDIDLSNANVDIAEIEGKIIESLYANDDFIEFLSAVKVSSDKYVEANGYYSPNLLNTETFLNSVQVTPTVNFDGKKLKTDVRGTVTLDVNNGNGAKIGTLSVDFDFYIETQLKVDVNYDIKTEWKGIKLEKFDVAIMQTDSIGFDFRVSVDSKEIGNSGYVINKNTGEAHLACCVEVTRASDPSIFEKTSQEDAQSANLKCSHCKPENGASLENDFNGYYMNTLYCSDWEKVASDIKKLTSVDKKGAKVNVTLGSVEIPICGPVAINIDLGFALSFDARAIMDYSYSYTQRSTYGMRLNHGYMQPYSQMSNGSVTQNDLAVLGSAEARVGLSVDTHVTISGFEKWINAGVKAEVGAYSELNGVLDSDKDFHGAYLELGAYLDIDAYYKLIKKDGSSDLAEIKRALAKYGYEKLYFAYEKYEEKLNILGSYDIAGNDLLKVMYFDLVNMVVKTDELSLSERSKYQVSISFADGTYCELKNGVIVYKVGAPKVFNDTIIVTVTSGDDWKSYRKGSAICYLGTYEIDFEFDTNHMHTWSEASCTSAKVCSGCGLKDGNELGHDFANYVDDGNATCTENGTETATCSRCFATDTRVMLGSATGHDWAEATCYTPQTCNNCGAKVGTVSHNESDWIIDVEATENGEGSKHTECTLCGEWILTEIINPTASQGLKYTLNSDGEGYSVIGMGTCADEIVVIPSEHNGLPVKAIAREAFWGCTSIKSMNIPDSVMSINYGAFAYCISLESVVIGDSVTSIGDSAFYNCASLTSVTIPDSVKSIGSFAFYDCSLLTNIAIPDSVTSIGGYAFYRCSSLTNINIPDGITSIGGMTFEGCSGLQSIVIPNSVTSIGSWAFGGCNSLTKVVIPDSVTSIEGSAFRNCTSIVEFKIGSGVMSIGEGVFAGCKSLIEIDIPQSVTSIGSEAFHYCESLTNVNIPDSVISIGKLAFYGCISLTSIEIPDSVTSISEWTFGNCESLASIVIPDSVTSIGSYAFNGCSSLTSITIPDSVTSINEWTFGHCLSLTSIEIPNSVTSIGGFAFRLCISLTSIEIPDSVTSIGDYAFYESYSLTSITVPDSVTSIGEGAFDSCSSLKIYCEAESQPSGWNSKWNPDNRPVVWGYKPE